jgi:hypothetical protein
MAQPNGTFFILSRDRPNFAISVLKKSKEPDVLLMEEQFTGGMKQQWIIENGVVRNVNSRLVWTMSGRGLHQDYYRPTDPWQRFHFAKDNLIWSSFAILGYWRHPQYGIPFIRRGTFLMSSFSGLSVELKPVS